MSEHDQATVIAVDEDGRYIGKFSGVAPPSGAIIVPEDTDDASRVWIFAEKRWSDPAPPDILVKAEKLVQAAFAAGMLTLEEAKQFGGSGVIPAVIASAIATLPPEERSIVELRASVLTEYSLNDPILRKVWLAIPGMTPASLAALFTAADKL